MNKKNLKMGPVGPEYMEQYNALLDRLCKNNCCC